MAARRRTEDQIELTQNSRIKRETRDADSLEFERFEGHCLHSDFKVAIPRILELMFHVIRML